MNALLMQMTIYLAAAVIAVPIACRLGFGSVLGYLAAGLIIGPGLGLIGSEAEELSHYAEFGVVLMLFLIGLELEPKALWRMRRGLVGLGGLQVGLTLAAIAAVALAAGLAWTQALAVGMILCLSSTAIVMQTFKEKRLTRTEGGRAGFSVLLFQDIAALPFLAVIPLLALGVAPPEPTEDPVPFVENLSAWMRALLVLGLGAAVVIAGRYLTRPIFRFITLSGMPEISVAAALLFVVGIAAAMGQLVHSAALGTFLAGVVLANSEYRHEVESDIAPFKGLLLGLFFLTVGASIDLRLLAAEPLLIGSLVLGLMLLKLAILFGLATAFRFKARDRVLFSLALAQAGEFGFFLTSFATQSRALTGTVSEYVLIVISLSMFLTPALFLAYDRIAARLGADRPDDEIDERGTVIIAGMGRFGQIVNRMLKGVGESTIVLDNRAEVIERMSRFGIKAFYGEVDRPALLEAAGIAEAKALVIAVDDPEATLRIARHVGRLHPEVKIIARARDRHHVYQLYAAGVRDSVREVFDGAVRAGKYALAALDYSDDEVERVGRAFFDHDRHMLAELSEVWDPAVPIEDNPAYIARAREQNETIERELRGRLERPDQAAE